MNLKLIAATVLSLAVLSGSAMAQSTTTTTQTPSTGATTAKSLPKTKTPKATSKVHSEKSIACSAEADKRQLHGAARKKFRSECKKGKMPS
jgi:hypothetical protein